MTYSEFVDQAKASKEAADNYKKMANDSKKTADNVKKQLASFDEISILVSGNKDTNSFGDFSGFEALKEYDTSGEEDMLGNLMKVVGGALAALGVILLFKGSIGWGIGFLIEGAVAFGISEATTGENDLGHLEKTIKNLALAVEGALIAIGIYLITKRKIGLGIGFISKGATGIGITEMAAGNFSEKSIEDWLNEIESVAAGAMIALGVMMLYFKTNLPVAISLIAGGALLLVDNILDIAEDGMTSEISKWINALMVILEGAALAIGIILVLTKVNIPLGVSLIATGAATLAKEVAVNWDAIWEFITQAFDRITEWIKTYGTLALGIILLVSGVNVLLGLALIADGAGSLSKGETAIPGKFILDTIAQIWEDITAYWNANIANIWTIEFWLGLAKIAGNGLIAGFEAAVNGIIILFENAINFIVDSLNKISFDIPDWLGGGHFGISLSRAQLGRVSIPRLAQGTVVPPNKEFMAILGDNTKEHEIVSPVSTMKQAFMEAMVEMGGTGQTTREEHYYLNETELMSVVYRLVKGGERLSGESLVVGGAY
jgi:hypothetical protein